MKNPFRTLPALPALPMNKLDYDIILAVGSATPGLKVRKSYNFPLILQNLELRFRRQQSLKNLTRDL